METHQRREHQIDMNPSLISNSNTRSSKMISKSKSHKSSKNCFQKSRHYKQWQRKFYDYIINSKMGMTIALIFLLLFFWTIFDFISYFIQYFWAYLTGFQSINYLNSNISKYYKKLPFCHHCSDVNFRDNIRGAPLEHSICYEPMDIVYTWVNGSDPILQEGMKYNNLYLLIKR